MKPLDSNNLNNGTTGVTTLQAGRFGEFSLAACGQLLLEVAGLTTLEDTKNAFVGDPGTTVTVMPSTQQRGFVIDGANDGWLVVDSCGGDHRGTVHTTFAGAAAQVWALVSMQDAGTVTMAEPNSKESPVFSFEGMGKVGMKSIVMSSLSKS
jgi:hypothetical protein